MKSSAVNFQQLPDLKIQIFRRLFFCLRSKLQPQMKAVIPGSFPLFGGGRFLGRFDFDKDSSLLKKRNHNIVEPVVRKREIAQFPSGIVFQIQPMVFQPGRRKRFSLFKI